MLIAHNLKQHPATRMLFTALPRDIPPSFSVCTRKHGPELPLLNSVPKGPWSLKVGASMCAVNAEHGIGRARVAEPAEEWVRFTAAAPPPLRPLRRTGQIFEPSTAHNDTSDRGVRLKVL